jgi:hypothetical protein
MRHIPLTHNEVDNLLDFAEASKDAKRQEGYSHPLNGVQVRLEQACTSDENSVKVARNYVEWVHANCSSDGRETVKKSIK